MSGGHWNSPQLSLANLMIKGPLIRRIPSGSILQLISHQHYKVSLAQREKLISPGEEGVIEKKQITGAVFQQGQGKEPDFPSDSDSSSADEADIDEAIEHPIKTKQLDNKTTENPIKEGSINLPQKRKKEEKTFKTFKFRVV